jgi:undecaprenyl diphosphate synthase
VTKKPPPPRHVGIIMDGNSRWAKAKKLPQKAGHKKGGETFEKIALYSQKIGVQNLTVFAFSTENWRRPRSEIDDLMELFRAFAKKMGKNFGQKNMRVRIIGDISVFDADIQETVSELERSTRENTGMTLNVAANYGSRAEITGVCREIAWLAQRNELSPDEITEEMITRKLFVPDVDLVIMPGSRRRLSNFLLWQASYAEFWTTDTLWPDFSEREIDAAVEYFSRLERKFGAR